MKVSRSQCGTAAHASAGRDLHPAPKPRGQRGDKKKRNLAVSTCFSQWSTGVKVSVGTMLTGKESPWSLMKTATPTLRAQVQFNLGATPTYASVRNSLVEYHMFRRQWNPTRHHAAHDDPLEIDAMDNVSDKGKSKGKGKDASGEKGNDKGKQPKGKGRGKATIGWNCLKPGHRQAHCSFAQVAPAPAVHADTVAPSPQPDAHMHTVPEQSQNTITTNGITYKNNATSCRYISDTWRFAQCLKHKSF